MIRSIAIRTFVSAIGILIFTVYESTAFGQKNETPQRLQEVPELIGLRSVVPLDIPVVKPADRQRYFGDVKRTMKALILSEAELVISRAMAADGSEVEEKRTWTIVFADVAREKSASWDEETLKLLAQLFERIGRAEARIRLSGKELKALKEWGLEIPLSKDADLDRVEVDLVGAKLTKLKILTDTRARPQAFDLEVFTRDTLDSGRRVYLVSSLTLEAKITVKEPGQDRIEDHPIQTELLGMKLPE